MKLLTWTFWPLITFAQSFEVCGSLWAQILKELYQNFISSFLVSQLDVQFNYWSSLTWVIHLSSFIGSLLLIKIMVGSVDILEVLKSPLKEVGSIADIHFIIQVNNDVVFVFEEGTFLFSLQFTQVVHPWVWIKYIHIEWINKPFCLQFSRTHFNLNQFVGHNAWDLNSKLWQLSSHI